VAGSSPAPGAVYCWGRNREGQLGDGSVIDQFTPTMISGTLTFRQISAGDLASCGLSSDRIAYCWGDNQYGQIGDATQTRRTAPARVVFQP
jgi:serine/threonine-protein kinase